MTKRSRLKIITKKDPISSELREEPSLFDLVTLYGEESQKFVNLPTLFSYAITSLPDDKARILAKNYYDTRLSYEVRYENYELDH